jgi:hypothetical protein
MAVWMASHSPESTFGSDDDIFFTIATGPDTDGDGLSDGEEVNVYGTDPRLADTDGDGLSDGEEVNVHGTDPHLTDTDGDTWSDALDNCPLVANSGQEDADGDAIGDACDNCPATAGSDQTDPDLDGFGGACDCDNNDPDRYPGAAERCNGLDDDCDDVVPGSEDDQDLDGYRVCQGDCDDTNSATHPGSVEVNDGEDNQCPGHYGYGIADEIESADLTGNTFSWSAQPGATLYQYIRSSTPDFTAGCVSGTTGDSSWTDLTVPPVGSSYQYLVRPVLPHVGSWGGSWTLPSMIMVERTVSCSNLMETDCSDLVDDDLDGLIDCLDDDCDGIGGCEHGTETTCDDTLDNDGDGVADCSDPDCDGVSGCA